MKSKMHLHIKTGKLFLFSWVRDGKSNGVITWFLKIVLTLKEKNYNDVINLPSANWAAMPLNLFNGTETSILLSVKTPALTGHEQEWPASLKKGQITSLYQRWNMSHTFSRQEPMPSTQGIVSGNFCPPMTKVLLRVSSNSASSGKSCDRATLEVR